MQQRVAPLARPVSATIVAALLACAAVAWLITFRQAGSMGMGGLAMMTAGLFLVTWLVMMVAMMFPSVAPMTLAFASFTRSRGEGYVPTAVFVLGYLAVWTAAGLVPLAVLQAVDKIWMTPPSWLPRAGAAVIIVAGIYQFTPLKDACLRACRSPLGFIMTHNFGGGPAAAVRAGMSHGVYCLGCCWALMVVLVVAGSMGLPWVVGIALVVFAEKLLPPGRAFGRGIGLALLAGAALLVLRPDLVPFLAQGAM